MRVYETLEDLLAGREVEPKQEMIMSKPPTKEKTLYIIEDELERVKVGITENLSSRLTAIERASGLQLVQIKAYPHLTNAHKIEQRVLKEFEAERINCSEWLTGFNARTRREGAMFDLVVQEVEDLLGDELGD